MDANVPASVRDGMKALAADKLMPTDLDILALLPDDQPSLLKKKRRRGKP